MNRPLTLFNYSFRSFFLLAAASGVILIAAWLALLNGMRWSGAPLNIIAWHGHELLFGFGLAAVAGFILTAMAVWTGRPQVQGSALAMLVLAWLVGRFAMLFSSMLPVWLLLTLVLAFPALLAVTVSREIIAAGNRRHYPLVTVIVILALLDGFSLLAYSGVLMHTSWAQSLALHLLLLLIAIIGGRIIPAFSTNWLRQQGVPQLPQTRPWLERVVIGLTLAVGLIDSLLPGGLLLTLFAATGALAHGARLIGWRGWQTWRNPLLLILHLGYAWLPLGYLLLTLHSAGLGIDYSAALHVFGVGAMGTMILAVMTRVTLGHTGRPLDVGGATVLLYGCILTAGLTRLAASVYPTAYPTLLGISGLFWIAAFALFLAVYGPMLCQLRVDGKPERTPPRSSPPR